MAQAGVKPYIKRYHGVRTWWIAGVPDFSRWPMTSQIRFIETACPTWHGAMAELAAWYAKQGYILKMAGPRLPLLARDTDLPVNG